jgi:hypothetical protein
MKHSISLNTSRLLELPMIIQIRRNHALEHATLHTLANHLLPSALMGHSDFGGFWIIGDVPPETLHTSVLEALSRLRAGEHQLAIHPNCGTNYITAGTLAGLAGAAAMIGSGKRLKDKLGRLPIAAALATLALVFSQPLGLLIQARLTTSADLGSLEVLSINHKTQGRISVHRVQTRA